MTALCITAKQGFPKKERKPSNCWLVCWSFFFFFLEMKGIFLKSFFLLKQGDTPLAQRTNLSEGDVKKNKRHDLCNTDVVDVSNKDDYRHKK